MKQYRVYVVSDRELIECLVCGDEEGFWSRAFGEEPTYDIHLEEFDTQAEADGFCRGLGYSDPEWALPLRYPLCSWDDPTGITRHLQHEI